MTLLRDLPFRFLILFAVLLLVVAANLLIGETEIAPQEILQALLPKELESTDADIIRHIRLPRLLTALAVGAALAVAGYLLQTLSRNPLADPFLTGVSAGAGLGVAVVLTFGISTGLIPIAAFAGGLAASIIVAAAARDPLGLSISRLLLAGIAVSSICSAITTMIVTGSGDIVRAQGILFWLAGGISGAGWDGVRVCSAYTSIGMISALILSKQIRMLSLGRDHAASIGMNVEISSWSLLAISCLLCGAAVSVSGIVGFVGLVAPNITRSLFGNDERAQIIATATTGMILVAISDLAARSLIAGQELPLGTLLSLLGGPFFLLLLARQKGEMR